MSTKIKDEDFPNPSEVNELECFTASRYLQKVDESVEVVQVCQDPNNPALVVIDFVLVGAFEFTPFCKILSVDGDRLFELNGIEAPLAIGHFQNPEIPINTNCQTYHGQVVFDFGDVIPNFLSSLEIEFELGMVGQVPLAFGVNFPNQTPTDKYLWTKGVLPSPVNLTYNNGNLNILFEYGGELDCSCNIQCVQPTGVTQSVQFCPDEEQTITIFTGPLSGDPSNVLLQLSDGFGNLHDISIQSLIGVNPEPPIVHTDNSPKRIEVFISRRSLSGTALKNVEYQIFKYQGTENNYSTWKDWSHRDWDYFVDYDVIPGETYGYAVRYKGEYNDITNLSSWSTISL